MTQSAQDFAASIGIIRTRRAKDSSDEAILGGYRNQFAPGSASPIEGDDIGPYSRPRPLPLLSSHTIATGGEISRIVDEPVRFYECEAFNATGGDLYMLVFDATSVPANGTVPILPACRVPTLSTVALAIPEGGIDCNKGVVVVFSSTSLTLTVAGVASGSIAIQYREPDEES